MTTITFNGTPLQTIGQLPIIGQPAPDFALTKIDLSEISLKNYLGKPIVLNIFPSLDTVTCATAMQRFNEIAKAYPEILILCVSADLPFAQKRFCASEHLNNVQPVSVFRHSEFGENYGVSILESPLEGLLSRAVVILDKKGIVRYTQQVQEITEEPDYAAITTALNETLTPSLDL
ncbi:MAG: thiol peroxidase [Gammaproteobacteria bacterium]|nr:thiol peroxidase [Gammaproteobacteria bacterium]